MLLSLSVNSYAIIDNISITFGDGMNVLTGETGAGKSILVGALSMALGYRSSSEMVRTGETKAVVKALFSVEEDDKSVLDILAEQGVECEDGTILIQREIYANGRNVCKINDTLVNVSALKTLGLLLVDIHGQHEHQKILDPETHLSLLDEYGSEDLGDLLKATREDYLTMKSANLRWKKLVEQARDGTEAQNAFMSRLSDIEDADLKIGEDEEIKQRIDLLKNSEKIFNLIDSAYNTLYGSMPSVIESLNTASIALDNAQRLDPTLTQYARNVSDAYVSLDDTVLAIRDYRDRIEYSQEEIDTLSARLSRIEKLKRKYGETIEEILNYRDELKDSLSIIKNIDEELEKAKELYDGAKEKYLRGAERLSCERKRVAEDLSRRLVEVLSELNMGSVKFAVDFKPFDGKTLSSSGIDRAEFLISTNAGESLKPLSKVASGGEISRIMLALKSIFADADRTDTLIFDEIDTGISGRTAQVVAEKMVELSLNHQLICISHLPQIASMASTHIVIDKAEENGRTHTEVNIIEGEDRTREIARMISGVEVTDVTLSSAREMLSQARDYEKLING